MGCMARLSLADRRGVYGTHLTVPYEAGPPTTGGYALSRSAQSLLQERAMGFGTIANRLNSTVIKTF